MFTQSSADMVCVDVAVELGEVWVASLVNVEVSASGGHVVSRSQSVLPLTYYCLDHVDVEEEIKQRFHALFDML